MRKISASGGLVPGLQSLWITTWCSSDIPNRASKVTSDGHRNPFFQPALHPGGGQIVETPFTSASDMDDMLLQCNKNAIYVLNSSYAYGEFGRLNLFGSTNESTTGLGNNNVTPALSNFSQDNFCRTSATTTINSPMSHSSTSCSSIPKLFQCIRDENQNRQHQQLDSFNKCTRTNTNTSNSTLPIGGNAKKNSGVKSAIIAKKTKFWKCLEEEKWKKQSIENLSTTNCERNSDSRSSKKTSSSNNNTNTNSNNHNNNNSNRSRRNDNNNRKSSTELYREAAQLLGLSCTLCDNCRCLDCQSRYFECDDSDTYSEISFMGEYIETLQEQNLTDCSRNQYSNCSDNERNSHLDGEHDQHIMEDATGSDSNDVTDN